jgi:hypothetical protein
MKLTGKYRLVIEGDIEEMCRHGRNKDMIGYILQRLLSGQEAAVEELDSWGIEVRLVDEYIAIPRLD